MQWRWMKYGKKEHRQELKIKRDPPNFSKLSKLIDFFHCWTKKKPHTNHKAGPGPASWTNKHGPLALKTFQRLATE